MLRGWTECTVSRRAQPGKQNSFRVFKHGISYKELVTQRLEELRSPGGDGKVTRNPLLVLGWGENSVISGGGPGSLGRSWNHRGDTIHFHRYRSGLSRTKILLSFHVPPSGLLPEPLIGPEPAGVSHLQCRTEKVRTRWEGNSPGPLPGWDGRG